jgi:hypothetical protein
VAVTGRGGRQELVHPRIVVGAVDDDDPRIGDLARDARRGLEQMWVLIGVRHDADDGDPVAADLAGYVAIEVLRRDHGDPAAILGSGWPMSEKRKSNSGGGRQRG